MEILRDQYLDYLAGRAFERPIFIEMFGLLVGLDEEWRRQGASDDEISLKAFDFDHIRKHSVRVCVGRLVDWTETLLEETPEYRITRDSLGRRMKLIKKTGTIALPLDHPVTDMDSWLKLKPIYEFDAARWREGWLEAARAARAAGDVIRVAIPGGFDEPRQLLGEENVCLACYEQPELLHDILDTIGATAERVLDRVSREIQIDELGVHEDMAGKSGALWGPKQIEEFIKPYYRRIWDMLSARGAQVFEQDSDGNMNGVIPAFLDAGLTSMHPMEPAAGMDIVAVRRMYGSRLAVAGGIDKHVLRRSQAEIRAELEYKMQPTMRRGGVIFSLDHRIPNGTPIENYRYYVRTAREILGLPPLEPCMRSAVR